MPNYKSHLSAGCIVFSIVLLMIVPYHNPSIITAGEWFLFALAGSLFPDIDIKSKGQRYFYWFLFLLILLLTATQQFIALAIISTLSMIPLLSKHRGLFHRTWFVIGVPYLAWYIASYHYHSLANQLFFDVLFFVVGALSHLWLDLGIRKMMRI